MGGSSHRIEVLLLGIVTLLGGALALLSTQVPPRTAAPPQIESVSASVAEWLDRAAAHPALLGDLDAWLAQARPTLAAAVVNLLAWPVAWPALTGGAALLCTALVGSRLSRTSRARRPARIAVARQLVARLSRIQLPHLRAALPGRSVRLAPARAWLRRRLGGWSPRLSSSLDIAPVAPFLLDLPESHLPAQLDAELLLTEPPPGESHASPVDAASHADDQREVDTASHADDQREADWTLQDLAHVAAAALRAEWIERGLRSHLLALDVELYAGGGRARALIDANPAEERLLLALPERLGHQFPGWSASWRSGALALNISGSATPRDAGPLLAPVLRHGRAGRVLRYLPLDWPPAESGAAPSYLGIYGRSALSALNACLIDMLYAHPPSELALALLDAGQLTALYAGAPHLIRPPGSRRATVAALDRALRRGWLRERIRPLVLAVIEPDEALLGDLCALVKRLRQRPGAPLHLLIAQERPQVAGRELYALLPALVTSGGSGDARLLPGCSNWPRRGAARLATNGKALDGLPQLLEDSAVRAAIAALGPATASQPPVLWEAPIAADLVSVSDPWTPAHITGEQSPLAVRIERALDGRDDPHHAQPQTSDGLAPALSPWPSGPAGMTPGEVATLIEQLLSDPSINQASPPGVTRGRLASLMASDRRGGAAVLMAWLDAAGVLADPRDETLRWREPRPLRNCEPEWIAARLSETPQPPSVR